jgi:hypothetical protein
MIFVPFGVVVTVTDNIEVRVGVAEGIGGVCV